MFDSVVSYVSNLLPDSLQWWQILLLLADWTLKFIAIGWVPQDRKPTSAMAWLLAIFLIPFISLPLFFLMGSPYINRRRHRLQEHANQMIHTENQNRPDIPKSKAESVSETVEELIHMNRNLTAIPSRPGKLIALHRSIPETMEAIARAIDTAQVSVNVECYILGWDHTTAPMFEALIRAQKRGVKVRVLWDHIGSASYPGTKGLEKRLKQHGIESTVMLPLKPWKWRFRRPDLRNHRKLVVIDGRHAFMGSMNLIDQYYESRPSSSRREWVDIMAEVHGPIVTSINTIFAVDWFTEVEEVVDITVPEGFTSYLDAEILASLQPDPGGSPASSGDGRIAASVPATPEQAADAAEVMQILPSGPGFRTEPNLRLFTAVAQRAQKRLVLVSPYFIPDEALMEAVTTACYRGVTVDLFVSEKSDQFMVGHAQSSYYKELLNAGVQIHRYPTPQVLHSKFMIADDQVAIMGSSNMDMRSFGLNYEISLMSGSGEVLSALNTTVERYNEVSSTLSQEEWEQRKWYNTYLDNVCRLTSALQ